jgi:hypothetical protein
MQLANGPKLGDSGRRLNAAGMSELLQHLEPAPSEALTLLYEAACREGDDGSKQARFILFFLAGKGDPTRVPGQALEMKRANKEIRQALIEVLQWWTGSPKSEEPFKEVMRKLHAKFPTGESPVSFGESIR